MQRSDALMERSSKGADQHSYCKLASVQHRQQCIDSLNGSKDACLAFSGLVKEV